MSKKTFISEDFLRITDSDCTDSNTYEQYDQISLAEIACSSSPECVAIRGSCYTDAFGDPWWEKYRLCKGGFLVYTKMSFSDQCVYKKKNFLGKYYFR